MAQVRAFSDALEIVEFSEIMRFDGEIIFGLVVKNNVLDIYTSYAGTSNPITGLYGLSCEEVNTQTENKYESGDDSYVWEYVPRRITFSEEKLFDEWDICSWWIGTDYAPFGKRSFGFDYAKRGTIKLAAYITFLEE